MKKAQLEGYRSRSAYKLLELHEKDRLIKPGMFRLVPTAANGQPGYAAYQRDAGGVYRAHAVLVLALSPTGIARVDIFLEPGLFGRFGLPEVAA